MNNYMYINNKERYLTMNEYDVFVKFYMLEECEFDEIYKPFIKNSKLFYDIVSKESLNDDEYDENDPEVMFYLSVYYRIEKYDYVKFIRYWFKAVLNGYENIEDYLNMENNDANPPNMIEELNTMSCQLFDKYPNNRKIYKAIYDYYEYIENKEYMLIIAKKAESQNIFEFIMNYYFNENNYDILKTYWIKIDDYRDASVLYDIYYFENNCKNDFTKFCEFMYDKNILLNILKYNWKKNMTDSKKYMVKYIETLYSDEPLIDDIIDSQIILNKEHLLQLESRCITKKHVNSFYDMLKYIYNSNKIMIKEYYDGKIDYNEQIEFIELCHNKLIDYHHNAIINKDSEIIYKYAELYKFDINEEFDTNEELYLKYIMMAASLKNEKALYRLVLNNFNKEQYTIGAKFCIQSILHNQSLSISAYENNIDDFDFDKNIIEEQLHTLINKTIYFIHRYVEYIKKNNNQLQGYINIKSIFNKSLLSFSEKKTLLKILKKLEKHNEIIMYNNNCKLFERLNNYKQCPICLENNILNINISCGHEICYICYPKFKNKCYYNFCPLNNNNTNNDGNDNSTDNDENDNSENNDEDENSENNDEDDIDNNDENDINNNENNNSADNNGNNNSSDNNENNNDEIDNDGDNISTDDENNIDGNALLMKYLIFPFCESGSDSDSDN